MGLIRSISFTEQTPMSIVSSKGESPANLPAQSPIKYELIVNLKTAKSLNLAISDSFILLADEVIE